MEFRWGKINHYFKLLLSHLPTFKFWLIFMHWHRLRTTWRHKSSKKPENLGRCDRKNMLQPYLKIWEWKLIFEQAVKAISTPGVCSLFALTLRKRDTFNFGSSLACFSISSQMHEITVSQLFNLRSLLCEPKLNLDSFSEMLPILPEKDKKYDFRQFLSLIIVPTYYKQFLN